MAKLRDFSRTWCVPPPSPRRPTVLLTPQGMRSPTRPLLPRVAGVLQALALAVLVSVVAAQLPLITEVTSPPAGVAWGAKCGGKSGPLIHHSQSSDYAAELRADLFQPGDADTNIDSWLTTDSHCTDPFSIVPTLSFVNVSSFTASPALVQASVISTNPDAWFSDTVFAIEGTVVTFLCWHKAVPDLFVFTEEPSYFGDEPDGTGSAQQDGAESLDPVDVTNDPDTDTDTDKNIDASTTDGLDGTLDTILNTESGSALTDGDGAASEPAPEPEASYVNLTTLLPGTSLIPALPAAPTATVTSADLGTTIALTCRRGRWHTRTHLREAPSAAAPTVPGAAKVNTVATRPVVLARCPAQCAPHPLARALPPHMRLHYSRYAVASADQGVLPPPILGSARSSPTLIAVLAAAAAAVDGKLDGISAEDLPGVGGGLIDGPRTFADGVFAHFACRNAATSNTTTRPLATYQCHASATGPGEWRLVWSSVPAIVPASVGTEPAAEAVEAFAESLPQSVPTAHARSHLIMCAMCLPVVCDGFPDTYTSTVGLLTTYSQPPLFPGAQPQHLASSLSETRQLPFRGRRFPSGTVVSFSCPLGGLPVPQSTLSAVPAATQFECRALRTGATQPRAFGDTWCGYSDIDCGTTPTTPFAPGMAPAAQVAVAAAIDATAAVQAGFRRGAWVAVETNQTLGNGVGLPLCVPSECLHLPQWAKPKSSLLQAITISAYSASTSGLRTELTTVCPNHYTSTTPALGATGSLSCVDGVWTAEGIGCRPDTVCVLPMHQAAATRLRFLTLPVLDLPKVAAVDGQRDSMALPWRDADETHYPVGAALQQSCSSAGEFPNVNGAGVIWRSCGRGAYRLDPLRATEVDDYSGQSTFPDKDGDSTLELVPYWNNVTLSSQQVCAPAECPSIAGLRWAGYDPVSQLQYVFDASTATTPVPPAMGSSITHYCTEPGYESVSSHTCNATARWVPPLLKDLAGADTLAPCPRRSCWLPLQLASCGSLQSEGAIVTLSGASAAIVTEKVFNGNAVVDQSDPKAPQVGDTLGRLDDPRLPVKVAPGTTATATCKPGFAAVDQYGAALGTLTVTDTCSDTVQSVTGLTFAKWTSFATVPTKVPAYTGNVPPDAIASVAMKHFYCEPALCPVMTIALARQLLMLPGADEIDFSLESYQLTYPTPSLVTGVGSVRVGARAYLRCAPGYVPVSAFETEGVPALYNSEGVVAAQCMQSESGSPAKWRRINASTDASANEAWTEGNVMTSSVVSESMLLCEKLHPRCSSDNGLTGNYRYTFGPPSSFNASEKDPAPFQHYNSVMVVKCKRRFIPAASRFTCNAAGEWVGTLPTCVAVECGKLPLVTYSGLRISAVQLLEDGTAPDPMLGIPTGVGWSYMYLVNSWPYGVHMYYMCPTTSHQNWARFTTPDVNKHVNFTCEHDGVSSYGNWTKTKAQIDAELSCVTTVCEDIAGSLQGYVTSLQQPSGSNVSYPAVNSRITLQCPAGTYGGQSYLVCAADGSWRGEPPNCTSRASCPALALDSMTSQPLPVAQGGETLTPQFVQVTLFTDAINITGGILHSDSIDPATVGSFEMGTVARYSCATDAPTQFASSVAPLYRICDGLTGRWTWAAEAAAFSCVAPRCPALSTIMSAHHAVLLATPVSNVTYSDSTMKPASAVTGTPGQSVYVRCRNPSRPSDLDWVRVECESQTRLWKYNITALPLCLDLQCARPDLPTNMTITTINGTFARPWTSAPTMFRDTVTVGSAIVIGCVSGTHPSSRSPRSLWMRCEAADAGFAGAVWTNSTLLSIVSDSATALATGFGGIPLSASEFRCQTSTLEAACLHMGSDLANLITSTPMKVAAHTYPLVGSAATLACAASANALANLPEIAADSALESISPISRKMLRMRSFSALANTSADGVDDPLSFRANTVYCSPSGSWTGVFPTCGTAPPAVYTGCGAPPLPTSTDSAIVVRADMLELPAAVSATVNSAKTYPLGARASYSCAAGYVPAGGAELRATCQTRAAATHTAAPQWTNTDGVSGFSCVRAECPLQPSFNGSTYVTAVVSQVALGGWSNPMLVASSTGLPLGTVLRAQCREDAARALGREHDEISWTCVQRGVVAEWQSANAGFVLGLCVPVATAAFAACELPNAVENAAFTLSAHNGDTNTASYPLADSVITYECNEYTHLIAGTLSRRCMSTGTWSGSAPVCTTTPMCHSAVRLLGANATQTSLANAGVQLAYSSPAALGGSFAIATAVTISCLATAGAVPFDAVNDSSRTYECIEESCSTNSTVRIGVWRLRDPDSGALVLSGPLVDNAFQCVIPHCVDLLPELKSRFIVSRQALPENTTRVYPEATVSLHLICARGYEASPSLSLSGPSDPVVCPLAPAGTLSTLQCLTDGLWYGVIPLCVPIHCPHVTETVYEVNASGEVVATNHVLPAGSLFDPSMPVSSGSTNMFNLPYTQCDLGEHCLLNGTISTVVPFAVGSFQTGVPYPEFRSVLTLSCPPGYKTNFTVVECAVNSRWYGTAPVCSLVYCDAPPATPQTMTVTVRAPGESGAAYSYMPTTGYLFGARATYSCRTNTSVTDSSALGRQTLTCSANGTWLRDAGVTVAVPMTDVCLFTANCPPLPLVVPFVGTQMVTTATYDAQRVSHPIGTLAALGCRTWFAPISGTVSTLNCTAAGWTPYDPSAGSVSTAPPVATASSTSSSVRMTVQALMSTTPLQCEPTTQCSAFPAITGGTVSYSDNRIPGSYVMPMCSSLSYKISTSTPIVCTRTTVALNASLDDLAATDDYSIGRHSAGIVASANVRTASFMTRSVAVPASVSTGYQWSVASVECVPRYDCGALPLLSPIAAIYYSSLFGATQLTLETARAYPTCVSERYVPVQDIVCRTDGWSTTTPCIPVQCPSPFQGMKGTDASPLPTLTVRKGMMVNDTYGSGYTVDTIVAFTCPENFVLSTVASAAVKCLSTSLWSSAPPSCVPYICPHFLTPFGQGLAPDPDTGITYA